MAAQKHTKDIQRRARRSQTASLSCHRSRSFTPATTSMSSARSPLIPIAPPPLKKPPLLSLARTRTGPRRSTPKTSSGGNPGHKQPAGLATAFDVLLLLGQV
jgi:hypothetical protein